MDAVFLKILNISITAGWLVIAILLLRPLLKKAPRWVMGVLWGLVALRLCLPFSVPSILSLIPSAETFPPAMLEGEEPYLYSGVHLLNSISTEYMREHLAPTPDASAAPMQIIMTIGGVLWAIGVAAMVVYMIVSYLRVRRRVAASVETDGIWLSDDIDTVFILGVFRPRIYAPSNMDLDDRVYALAHEKAHLKRFDHLWKPFGFLLLAVYWFHPLLWAAYLLMCRDIEISCDEKVIEALGDAHKKRYSHALIRAGACRRMVAVCPVAFGEVSIKERVRHVLSFKRPAFWVIIAALLLCAATAVCFLTDPPRKPTRLEELQEEYPEYFGLDTTNGLQVHAWKNNEKKLWYCGIWSDTEQKKTYEELHTLTASFRINELYLILSTYDIPHETITFTQHSDDGTPLDMGTLADLYLMPQGEIDSAARLRYLQGRFPECFGLDDSKGLDVYVRQQRENDFRCIVMAGNSLLTAEKKNAIPLTVSDMKLILDAYDLPKDEIQYHTYSASNEDLPEDFDPKALFNS